MALVRAGGVFRGAAVAVGVAGLTLYAATPLDLRTQAALAVGTFLLAAALARLAGRRAALVLVLVSVAATARYLVWRATATVGGEWSVDAALSAVLLLAELYSCAVLLLAYLQSVAPLPRRPLPLPHDRARWPTVDVLIPTYDEPLEVVRPTVLAATALDWPREKLRVHLLDDGGREAFRALARRAGAGYVARTEHGHAKAGNLNHALRLTRGEFVAVFDCDHVPARSFLRATMGWLVQDRRLALVQTPHHFYSPDPFTRNLRTPRAVPAESELFHALIQRGLDTWNAVFFCGSCAVLRRSALAEVGGIAVETVTEDAHTALKLHRRGWRTAFLGVPLAAGLATETLSAHVGQRIRWARGMAQIFRLDNPLLGRGLRLPQRLCYLAAMLHFFSGVPRLVFLLAPTAYLLFGRHVFNALPLAALAYGLPHLVHSTVANARIQGAVRHSFWSEVYETCLAWYVAVPTTLALLAPRLGRFNVTAKGGRVERDFLDARIARPYLLLAAVNIAAVTAGLTQLWGGAGELDALAINVAWAVHNLVVLAAALAVACERRQLRASHRVPARLPALLRARGGTVGAETLDLSRGGALVRVAAPLAKGERVALSVVLGRAGPALPATVVEGGGGRTRLAFGALTEAEDAWLLRAIFSRPDAWAGWLEGRRPDRPLLTLASIAGRGVAGAARAFVLALTSRAPPGPRSARRRAAAAARVALLAVALAGVARAEERRVELGPSAAERESRGPELRYGFGARADEELTAARVLVEVIPSPWKGPLDSAPRSGATLGASGNAAGLEVLVNDRRVALLDAAALARGGVHELPVDPAFLAPRSQLTLRVPGGCAAAPGAFRALRSVSVALRSDPVPLPDDLALLPLPFVDRGFDTAATVPVVLAAATPERLRLASLVASWLALDSPIPLRFEARVGALPDASALVLVAGAAEAARLGLPAPAGRAVAMRDHPRHPGANVKLVVVGGRDERELAEAVLALAGRRPALAGAEAPLAPPSPAAAALPYSAPRWMPPGRAVRLSDPAVTGSLAHEGARSATLRARFRISPDLWVWPEEFVVLDLGWSQHQPGGAPAPRLDVELNGYFLATLPRLAGEGDHQGEVRLRIPREHLRGFNELLVHVKFPDVDPCAAAPAAPASGPPLDAPRVAIAPGSTLHLEAFGHYAMLPDVRLFMLDGFPFTRVPDLSQTAVVVPDRPSVAELSAVLSVMGRLAQVTGRAGTGARFVPAARAEGDALAGRDLLAVGRLAGARLAAWSPRLPVRAAGDRLAPQRPEGSHALLDLLGGPGPLRDLARAEALLRDAPDAAVVAGGASPLSPGRSAIVLAAAPGTELPPFDRFLGYAESAAGPPDLLVVRGDRRALFHLGSSRGDGRLDAADRLRWFLAQHWLLLLPIVAAAVAALAPPLQHGLDRRVRARLADGGRA
jgi:cellulose synthase (UDP-forming)